MEEPKLYTYILMRDGKDKTFRVYGTEERCGGGPYQDIRRSQGLMTIDDEDIQIYRKE